MGGRDVLVLMEGSAGACTGDPWAARFCSLGFSALCWGFESGVTNDGANVYIILMLQILRLNS